MRDIFVFRGCITGSERIIICSRSSKELLALALRAKVQCPQFNYLVAWFVSALVCFANLKFIEQFSISPAIVRRMAGIDCVATTSVLLRVVVVSPTAILIEVLRATQNFFRFFLLLLLGKFFQSHLQFVVLLKT